MPHIMHIIGLILISGAVSYTGIFLSQKVNERIEHRKAMLQLLYYIKINISIGSVPLIEIYQRFTDKRLEKSGFLAKLRGNYPDALEHALSENKAFFLSEQEKKEYQAFASQLGRMGNAENEEALCCRYIELLERLACIENTKDDNRSRLYRRLSPVLGLLIAVLLI